MPDPTPPPVPGPGGPTPEVIFQTLNAFQRSAALKAGIDLDVFTAVAEGRQTASDVAAGSGASGRGVRILLDYLVVAGFLVKRDDRYALTPESATFLSRTSPAYLGGIAEFLLSSQLTDSFASLTEAVRKGGTAVPQDGTVAPEHPVWVQFARAMAPAMAGPAEAVANLVDPRADQPIRVLDIAAGHGLYGLAFARRNPQAKVVGLDWADVLQVARENAGRFGVAGRYDTIAGSALEVDFHGPYDVVLLPNFLHHFGRDGCVTAMNRVRAALPAGGRAVTVEFIPNPDRVTPPNAAAFALTMLATTPHGDAYTFAEYEEMFRTAGFARNELHELPPMSRVIVSQ